MTSWNKGQGRGLAFLRLLMGHRGSACVFWPFTRDTSGYGQCAQDGKLVRAHRLMCEMTYGPAPDSKSEAAHSCGRGHEGCVNPNHISWKTTTENKLDTVAHGNGKKAGGPRRKLTDEQVAEIRRLKGTKTYREMASMFGVHYRTVGLIATGYDRRSKGFRRSCDRIDEAQKDAMAKRARELRLAGVSWRKIGDEIGCSRLTAKSLATQRL